MGSLGVIHDRTSDCHLVSWAWMPPQVPDLTTERGFDSQATWVVDVLGLLTCYPCFPRPGTANVRSTGAEILYCAKDCVE